jgi:hypothetical protein
MAVHTGPDRHESEDGADKAGQQAYRRGNKANLFVYSKNRGGNACHQDNHKEHPKQGSFQGILPLQEHFQSTDHLSVYPLFPKNTLFLTRGEKIIKKELPHQEGIPPSPELCYIIEGKVIILAGSVWN